MTNIYINTFYGETVFDLPEPDYGSVSLRFHTMATQDGHFQPPELFYSGVIYGITSDNSHDSPVSSPSCSLYLCPEFWILVHKPSPFIV
jgi:hypothetical protein